MSFFAIAIAIATFIENDYGTIAAQAVIFSSWWLELCLFLLTIIFLWNIFKYKLYQIHRLPVLFLHLSFIFILVGAGCTRYLGKEGVMRIREGDFNNKFISSSTFLSYKVHNNKSQYIGEKKVILSSLSNNNFSIPIQFDNNTIQIQYVDFIHDPIDDVLEDKYNREESVLEFVIPADNGGMQSKYLLENQMKRINNLDIQFISGQGDFISSSDYEKDLTIIKDQNCDTCTFLFLSAYDVEYMKMSNQKKGVLPKSNLHYLNHKTLYTINGRNIVFKNHFKNATLKKVSSGIKNDESKLDLLQVRVLVNTKDTIINLTGSKGVVSPKIYFDFGDFFFSLGYGSKTYSLPFAIFLKDFQLERYPGSDSPSSFASEIQVLDGDKKMDYRIFMNNVLNYRGHRFFQSSYDSDEKGTILSVNKDKTGTIVTYFGYSCLLLSVISLLLSRFSRINLLSKKIKSN